MEEECLAEPTRACGVVIYSGAQKPLRVQRGRPSTFAGGRDSHETDRDAVRNGYRIDGSAVHVD